MKQQRLYSERNQNFPNFRLSLEAEFKNFAKYDRFEQHLRRLLQTFSIKYDIILINGTIIKSLDPKLFVGIQLIDQDNIGFQLKYHFIDDISIHLIKEFIDRIEISVTNQLNSFTICEIYFGNSIFSHFQDDYFPIIFRNISSLLLLTYGHQHNLIFSSYIMQQLKIKNNVKCDTNKVIPFANDSKIIDCINKMTYQYYKCLPNPLIRRFIELEKDIPVQFVCFE